MVDTRVYLDHAATSVLRDEVADVYLDALRALGNASAIHASGRKVRARFDEAIEEIAEILQVPPSWVIITASGTEADNLAVRGFYGAHEKARVLCSATEHPAVLDTVRVLAGEIIPVNTDGQVLPASLETQLQQGSGPALVSIHAVNNETGVYNDIAELARIAHENGAQFHTDAVQAIGHVPVLFNVGTDKQIDMLSLSGHKIGAPVGIGALVCDPKIKLAPHLTGGGQQREVRSGTLDMAGAIALATALRSAYQDFETTQQHYLQLREQLLRGIKALDLGIEFTAEAAPHSPHIVHITVPGADTDALLFSLDMAGIDASAGSACRAGVTTPSHVLSAMGLTDPHLARLRFSLGYTSTSEDISRVLSQLANAVTAARKVGALNRHRW